MNTPRESHYRQGNRQDPYMSQRGAGQRERGSDYERSSRLRGGPQEWDDREYTQTDWDERQNFSGWNDREDSGRMNESRYGFNNRQNYGQQGPGNWGANYSSGNYGNSRFDNLNGDFGYSDRTFGGNAGLRPNFRNGSLDNWTLNRNAQGQFTGRGPKGYRRSDERITEDVNEALFQNPELDASEIEVKVHNGEVTLTGTVEERQFKRLAEDVVERCSGVQDVHNQIRVQRSERDSSTESTENGSQQNKNKFAGSGKSESKVS